MDVAVVGAGRVGTALAVLLQQAGHRVVAVAGREATRERAARFLPGVPVHTAAEAAAAAQAVILALPDDALAGACADLAGSGALARDRAVVHLSGSVGLDVLEPARGAGAEVLCLHPLQTFPDVDSALERLPGSAMAVTAWTEAGVALGEGLARDVGGRPFRLEDRWKGLYHAGAVFASNYVTAVVALADLAFRGAGIDDPVAAFAPLARASLENALRMGPAAALTGPAARGDSGTVRRNLEALSRHAPAAVPSYVALATVALDLAEEAGRLDAEGRARVQRELIEWS